MGIKTGFNEAFIIDAATRDYLVDEDPRSAEIIKPCVIGDDVRKYEIQFRERYLIWTYIGVSIEQYPAVFNHLRQFEGRLVRRQDQGEHWWELRSCSYYDNFEKPKIIYPIIAKEPRFSLDLDYYFVNDKCFIIPQHDWYLLALLNSYLLFEMAKLSVSVLGDPNAGGRLELRAVHLQHLPIRPINFTTPADERDRQLEKAKNLYQRCLDRGSTDCVLGFVKHHLTADPERSDAVHDLLAFLAEQMVGLNKAKGEEIRGFLNWLERTIEVEIDTLQNRTAVQSYFNLSFERLLEILRRNRRSIAPNPSDRHFQELLEREFEASLAKLNPLLTRIRQTDELIDQVVYQLYGLDADEIAIVEGNV